MAEIIRQGHDWVAISWDDREGMEVFRRGGGQERFTAPPDDTYDSGPAIALIVDQGQVAA